MNRIKELNDRLGITREECRQLFDPPVPERTWAHWIAGTRVPAPWAEKLICQRLEAELKKRQKNRQKE